VLRCLRHSGLRNVVKTPSSVCRLCDFVYRAPLITRGRTKRRRRPNTLKNGHTNQERRRECHQRSNADKRAPAPNNNAAGSGHRCADQKPCRMSIPGHDDGRSRPANSRTDRNATTRGPEQQAAVVALQQLLPGQLSRRGTARSSSSRAAKPPSTSEHPHLKRTPRWIPAPSPLDPRSNMQRAGQPCG
jgi:hypothetical protein